MAGEQMVMKISSLLLSVFDKGFSVHARAISELTIILWSDDPRLALRDCQDDKSISKFAITKRTVKAEPFPAWQDLVGTLPNLIN